MSFLEVSAKILGIGIALPTCSTYPAFQVIVDHKAMAEEVGPVSEHLAALYTSLFGVAVDHAVVSFALL